MRGVAGRARAAADDKLGQRNLAIVRHAPPKSLWATMSLTQSKALALPIEVVDMIVKWISRPKDLLSLALSHSKFHSVIVPDHLHHRHVQFCIFDYAMWKYLLEDSYRLGKIETVQLSGHPIHRVPPIQGPTGNELSNPNQGNKIDRDLIHSVLKGMQRLHAVIWDSEDILEAPATAYNAPLMGIEKRALQIGPQLEELVMDEEHEPPEWRCPDLGSALRIISSAFPNLRLLDFACAYIKGCSAPSEGARPKLHDWISTLSEFNRLVALTIPWTQAEEQGITVRSSPSKGRHTTMEHFLNHCPRLRFLFCCSRRIQGEQEEFAILIGHKDADIGFRGALLIDEGSIGDRKWAAYDGKAKELADEVATALRANVC
ncbi:hypothetical protein FRC01_005488 [Tulasnella sp. 417]|nr:hypothetical protein FRC01_005488 [Tulasnella sp. 417]